MARAAATRNMNIRMSSLPFWSMRKAVPKSSSEARWLAVLSRTKRAPATLDDANKGAYADIMTSLDQADVKLCAQSCAAANIRRASRAITRLYGQFMAATGLEPTQYSLLVACSLHRRRDGQQTGRDFALDRSALARNLAVLEKRGLVKVKHGDDRRTRKIALTPFGEATLANALPHWREAQNAVESKFGAERLQKLLSELRVLTEATSPI